MLQVSSTNFTGNSGTNKGAIAMQSMTNATFSGITAVGNSAGCGGGIFVDRAASIQVTNHTAKLLPQVYKHKSSLHFQSSKQPRVSSYSCVKFAYTCQSRREWLLLALLLPAAPACAN